MIMIPQIEFQRESRGRSINVMSPKFLVYLLMSPLFPINPFFPIVTFQFPLKTSENLKVSEGNRNVILGRKWLNYFILFIFRKEQLKTKT